MTRHADHVLMCLPMVVAAFVLVVAGATALAILLVLICAVMMGALLAMVIRDGAGRGGDRP
jgi:hypothetical protein